MQPHCCEGGAVAECRVHDAERLEAERASTGRQRRGRQLTILAKNVQSLKADTRLCEFSCCLAETDFDILFVSETWRQESEEHLQLGGGHQAYLAGRCLSLFCTKYGFICRTS